MSTLVLRNVKLSPLTFTEMDDNFSNLNADKWDKGTDNYTVTETAGAVVTFSNVDAYPGRFDVTADDGGWAAGAHHCQVQFDFTTSTYFNPGGGHFGVGIHADPALVGTSFRGNGVLIGTCASDHVQSSDLSAAEGANIMLESWFSGSASSEDNFVFAGSDMPRGHNFKDGVNYRVIVDSCVDHEDNKWVRYRVMRKDNLWLTDTIDGSQGYWRMLHDSGYWYDANPWADFTKDGIYFYEVFSTGTWSIAISNLVVRWGPYLGQAEEATANVQYRNYDGTGTANKTPGLFPRAEDTYGEYNLPDTMMMTGFDNTNIVNAANASLWDWDSWVDADDLRTKLVAAGMSSTTADQIDTVFIPIVRVLALLCKHAKKVGW